MSDKAGQGLLKVEANAELSRLIDVGEANDKNISVEMTTLDSCRKRSRWGTVNFVKIDAEGQEPNVVRGGRQMLQNDSPLVMAEYKHGQQLNLTLLNEFAKELGFHAYRLVPGLSLLMPVADIEEEVPLSSQSVFL